MTRCERNPTAFSRGRRSSRSRYSGGGPDAGIDVAAIDHVNLRVPTDGIDAATDFYGDALGFAIEGLERFREGEQSFFDVRLAPGHVVHLWPTGEFEPPSGNGFNHVALRVDADRETSSSGWPPPASTSRWSWTHRWARPGARRRVTSGTPSATCWS